VPTANCGLLDTRRVTDAAMTHQRLQATQAQLCDALGSATELNSTYWHHGVTFASKKHLASWVGVCPGE
jgi:hypothetical protein